MAIDDPKAAFQKHYFREDEQSALDIVVGFYRGKDLYYAVRVRAGLVPATRRQASDAIKHLKMAKCPSVNLPEKDAGRWGQGFTAE
jgi:bifunctional non-homologous end joining protein LigD